MRKGLCLSGVHEVKLDENLPAELAPELRAMGHDTDTVADGGLCGEADPAVVEPLPLSIEFC
jgi:hypothetical protein